MRFSCLPLMAYHCFGEGERTQHPIWKSTGEPQSRVCSRGHGLSTGSASSSGGQIERLVENFFFTFLSDEGLERGDDFVPAGHDGVYLILVQITFSFLAKFSGVER